MTEMSQCLLGCGAVAGDRAGRVRVRREVANTVRRVRFESALRAHVVKCSSSRRFGSRVGNVNVYARVYFIGCLVADGTID